MENQSITLEKPDFKDFAGNMAQYLKAKAAYNAQRAIALRPDQVTVEGPERVVYVEKRVEVPVDNAETKARLERAESDLRRAENLLAKAQEVPGEPYRFSRSFLLERQIPGKSLAETDAAMWDRLKNIEARLNTAKAEDLDEHTLLQSHLFEFRQ